MNSAAGEGRSNDWDAATGVGARTRRAVSGRTSARARQRAGNFAATPHSTGSSMADLILALVMSVVYLALCVAVACGILAVASLLEEDE